MKTRVWSLYSVFTFFLVATSFAVTPLLSFNFNDSGTTSLNTGSLNTSIPSANLQNSSGAYDYHSGSGGGVSGVAGDLSLKLNDVSAMGGTATTAGGMMSVGNANMGTIQSITIAGWFKADEVIANAARIVDTGGFSINNMILCTTGPNSETGTFQFGVGGHAAYSTTAAYSDVGTWVFFAVTYDGSSVSFYKGTTSTAATLVNTVTGMGYGAFGTSASSYIYVGNTPSSSPAYKRTFDGYLDNIQIYGSTTDASGALSLSEIQSVQALAIPEPQIFALLLLGGACLVAYTRMFRPHHA